MEIESTLLSKLIEALGKERIKLIVGDRELIGLLWIKYLKGNKIPYFMRVSKGYLITLENGDCYSIDELSMTSSARYFQDCMGWMGFGEIVIYSDYRMMII